MIKDKAFDYWKNKQSKQEPIPLQKGAIESILSQKIKNHQTKIKKTILVDGIGALVVGIISTLVLWLFFTLQLEQVVMIAVLESILLFHAFFQLLALQRSSDKELKLALQTSIQWYNRYFLFYKIAIPAGLMLLTGYNLSALVDLLFSKAYSEYMPVEVGIVLLVGIIGFGTTSLAIRIGFRSKFNALKRMRKELESLEE